MALQFPTDADTKNPVLLARWAREVVTEIRKLGTLAAAVTGKPFILRDADIQAIQQQLQVHGRFPLNVEGLLGILALPQVAGLLVTSTLPSAAQYEVGTLAVLTGSPDTFYYNKADTTGTHVWQAISTAPANMMTTDSAQNVSGQKTFLNTALPIFGGFNGALWKPTVYSELLTLSNAGLTTDTAATLLPGSALILAVTLRITTTISGGGVTNITVGDATTAARFCSMGGTITAGSGNIGIDHWLGSVATNAAGPTQTSTAKVRITAVGGTPTAGVVRLNVFALEFTGPTS